MASEHDNAETAASDPFEAELVAYLDGELDEAAARRVEERLASDPAARARADELRKSFAMLDYLPRPEPSPNFTSRTLDMLPPVRAPATPPRPSEPAPAPRRAKAVRAAGGTLSTSMPVPLDESAEVAGRSRLLLWAGLVALVAACGLAGYGASALLRPDLSQRRESDGGIEPGARVIEYLPLYTIADDMDFVAELGKPEFFGDDPAVSFDPALRIASNEVFEKPSSQKAETLARAFRSLPPARQADIVKLDLDLHGKEAKERERLLRVLEAYAAWLARLPESERRHVLDAANSSARLEAIREIRERQWRNSLPAAVRARPDLIHQWKEEEAARRDRMAFIRQHAEAFAANKSPWPFDTEAGRKEVIEFARAAFKVDEGQRRCRLSPQELGEYRRTLAAAERDDAWAWYGLLVYELNRSHPYLPEPENPKLMIAEANELPEPYLSRVNPKKGFGLRPRLGSVGKWPDFPLEVLREIPLREGPFVKGPLPPLGPSRLGDFKQALRDFAAKELLPKMSGDEKRELQSHAGKWPDYPQRLIHYARKYDLSVPGAMLPGAPQKWDATYGANSRPRK